MLKIDLTGMWNVTGTSPDGQKLEITGTVPGCNLSDILRYEGKDPFYRDNAEQYRIYETYSWTYRKTFYAETCGREAYLVLERADTFCDVYLNGMFIDALSNGNVAHRLDITKALRQGENELILYFRSPVAVTAGKKPTEAAFSYDRVHIRRPQCTHGWDWTARFVTVGLSRDVFVEIWENPREVKTAYIYTKDIEEEGAVIGAEIAFFAENTNKIYDFYVQDKTGAVIKHIQKFCKEPLVKLDISVKNPKLWWPFTHGEQNLYDFIVKQAGETLYRAEFGIRKAVILEIADEKGSEAFRKCVSLSETPQGKEYSLDQSFSSFLLKINGKKVLCTGMNWVPCQPFPMGNTDEKITKILEMAKANGVNMIRVWGGAAFETEHFYDECSRLGILVTQDFLMACAKYPEDETWFIQNLQKEAEYASELLRNKACLMWWTGDNENAVNGCDTDEDYPGRRSMYEALAPVIYRMDPHRRIFASSPYGGKNYASNGCGTTHNTQYLGHMFHYMENSTDVRDYKEFLNTFTARFIAEEPCFGAADETALRRFMTEEDIYGEDDAMWYYHTKGNPALPKELGWYFLTFAEKMMGTFQNTKDRFFKFRYLQYEMARISMERLRRDMWFCSGNLFWMLNDCWPAAAGWAFIDYYNHPKAGLYAFKNLTKDIAVSFDYDGEAYHLYLSNTKEAQPVKTKIYLISESTKTLLSEKKVQAKKEMSYIADTVTQSLSENEIFVCEVVTGQGETVRCFYKHGDLKIFPKENAVTVTKRTSTGVTLQADAYVHVVELSGDPTVSDNYFFMMPGETREITCAQSGDITVTCYSFGEN